MRRFHLRFGGSFAGDRPLYGRLPSDSGPWLKPSLLCLSPVSEPTESSESVVGRVPPCRPPCSWVRPDATWNLGSGRTPIGRDVDQNWLPDSFRRRRSPPEERHPSRSAAPPALSAKGSFSKRASVVRPSNQAVLDLVMIWAQGNEIQPRSTDMAARRKRVGMVALGGISDPHWGAAGQTRGFSRPSGASGFNVALVGFLNRVLCPNRNARARRG